MTIIMPTAVEATPGSGPPDTDDNNSNTNNNKNNNANNTGGTGQSRSRKTRSFTEPARKKEEALEKAIKKKAALLEAAKALGEKKKNKAEEESREAMKKDFQEMTATDILHNLEEDIDDDKIKADEEDEEAKRPEDSKRKSDEEVITVDTSEDHQRNVRSRTGGSPMRTGNAPITNIADDLVIEELDIDVGLSSTAPTLISVVHGGVNELNSLGGAPQH